MNTKHVKVLFWFVDTLSGFLKQRFVVQNARRHEDDVGSLLRSTACGFNYLRGLIFSTWSTFEFCFSEVSCVERLI